MKIKVIFVLLVLGGFVFFQSNKSKDVAPAVPIDSSLKSESSLPVNPDADVEVEPGNVVSYTIDAKSFEFSKEEITASAGDTVKITLTNSGGKHDFVISEIPGANTGVISKGETKTIEFKIPENPEDSYAFFCSVGAHRSLGMEGVLTIK